MHIIRYTYPSRSFAPSFRFSGRSPWSGLESEMDRLFESALTGFGTTSAATSFPVDLYEDVNATYVRAELPGVDRKDISVEMVEGALTVQASRKEKVGEREQSVSLNRSIAIPNEVAADKVAAAYENGVLTVTLPKPEQAKPRKITISVN